MQRLTVDVIEWHDRVNNAKDFKELLKIYGETADEYDSIITGLEMDDKKHRFAELCGSILKPHHHIIDIGAGNGNLAMRLRKFNCTNIDAVEPVQELASIARKKNLYKNIYPEFISHKLQCSIASNTYDAAVSSGVVVPSHLEAADLDEMLRIVKVGGFVMFYYTSSWEGYEKFTTAMNSKLNDLETIGKIKLIKELFEESSKVNLISRLVAYSKEK